MTEITMPSLSDSMQEGTILSWLREDGEQVEAGDELLEIETDKATMTYESPSAGVLRIVAAVGETHPVGAVIAQLAAEADGAPVPKAAPEAESAERAAGNGTGPPVKATPLARRMAQAHGVDLDAVEGSGPRGRITRGDVAASAGLPSDPAAPMPTIQRDRPASASSPTTDSGGRQSTITQDLTRLQQVIARRMAEAKATIPEFQVQTEARIDALIALREEVKTLADDPVPSLNDFIVKACAMALRHHPRANGSYRDGRFELHERIHVGVAVAATDALVVPTITDADERSLRNIAAESRRLAARVRDATVTLPELSGPRSRSRIWGCTG